MPLFYYGESSGGADFELLCFKFLQEVRAGLRGGKRSFPQCDIVALKSHLSGFCLSPESQTESFVTHFTFSRIMKM